MAGSVNKVILVGNLGADPEVRDLNGGGKVATFRVATSESWRDKTSGERKEKTDWHTVVVFAEPLVKLTEQYLKKGMKVYVEGQLGTRKWEDQSGQPRYVTEILLKAFRGEIQMLDKQPSNRPPAVDGPDAYGSQSTRQESQLQSPGMSDMDDEIPF